MLRYNHLLPNSGIIIPETKSEDLKHAADCPFVEARESFGMPARGKIEEFSGIFAYGIWTFPIIDLLLSPDDGDGFSLPEEPSSE